MRRAGLCESDVSVRLSVRYSRYCIKTESVVSGIDQTYPTTCCYVPSRRASPHPHGRYPIILLGDRGILLKKVKGAYSSWDESHHRHHLPYRITHTCTTRQKWTRPALTPASKLVLDLPTPGDERLSWPRLLSNAPAGSRTRAATSRSPVRRPNHYTTQPPPGATIVLEGSVRFVTRAQLLFADEMRQLCHQRTSYNIIIILHTRYNVLSETTITQIF